MHSSAAEQQTLVSRDTNPALFTAHNKETQYEKENGFLCLKIEGFFIAEAKWLRERWMESLIFTSGKKEKIPNAPNWCSTQLLLGLISSKTHKHGSAKQSSNQNHAGLLSPAGLEFFCDNFVSLKNSLIIQTQAGIMGFVE